MTVLHQLTIDIVSAELKSGAGDNGECRKLSITWELTEKLLISLPFSPVSLYPLRWLTDFVDNAVSCRKLSKIRKSAGKKPKSQYQSTQKKFLEMKLLSTSNGKTSIVY